MCYEIDVIYKACAGFAVLSVRDIKDVSVVEKEG